MMIMERITEKYVFFWGSEFSNWFSHPFMFEGMSFYNSEQAFMWKKAMAFGDQDTADLILKTPSPRQAKALGRQVTPFDPVTWDNLAFNIMVDVNLAKFRSHVKLRNVLLSTGDKIIVEASPEDKIWGIGLDWSNDDCLDESKWQGQNLLGKALMMVREHLKTDTYGNNEMAPL